MEIQQAIIVVMLTAVICIFVSMMIKSVYPNDTPTDKLARIMVLGFVVIPWVLLVCTTDLYVENYRLRQDMTTYMACQGDPDEV
jgi:hypothetical protein